MLKLCIVLLASLPTCDATGAFGTLWVCDLRRAGPCWPGYELFASEHPDYGRNDFTMIASHPSQHWFTVHRVYVENPDAIDDVSDIYAARHRGQRTLQFIGYASFLLIMAKLLPMFAEGLVPWHETYIQSNDYPGELGCRVSVRSHLEPMVKMAEEENYMAKKDPIHATEPETMKRIVKAYAKVYVEGPWLSKKAKMRLSHVRKAMF